MALGSHLQTGTALLWAALGTARAFTCLTRASLGKKTAGLVAGDAMVEGDAGERSTVPSLVLCC